MAKQHKIAVHTPGPWEVTTPNSAVMEWRIGQVLLGENCGTPEGNAILISAAPDMLQALDSLVMACELGDRRAIELALPAAIAAIAKARTAC